MPRFSPSMIVMLAIVSGCAGKTYSVVNPVMGPPPPRISSTQTKTAELSQNSDIHQVSHTSRTPLPPTFVAARVNGHPLLVGEILEPFYTNLEKQEERIREGVRQYEQNPRTGLPPEKGDEIIRDTQEKIISVELDKLINLHIMSHNMKSKLKKDQLDSINTQLDESFQKDVVTELKAKTGAANLMELEAKLQENGASLESMRRRYALEAFRDEYLRAKMGTPPRPNRAEILNRYHQDQQKYLRPEKVKWQQLQISFKSGQNRSVAEANAQQALSEIQAGLPFDEAVQKYSDGPFKANGGFWDWTAPESIAIAEIRTALTSLRPGESSSLIHTSTGFQIVRLVDRVQKSFQPFDEVQNDIRTQIIKEWTETQQARVNSQIRDDAVVEIYLDLSKVEP